MSVYEATDTDVQIFINNLKSLKSLEKNIKRLQAEIGIIDHNMMNVHSMDLSKLRVNTNNKANFRHDLIDKKDPFIEAIKLNEQIIERTRMILMQLDKDDRKALVDLYVDNKTWVDVSREQHYSVKGLQKRLRRSIKSAIMELIKCGKLIM